MEEFELSLLDAAGAAEQMRDINEEGLPGSVAELSSAFEGLQIAIGEQGLTARVTGLFDKFTLFLTLLRESEGPWLSIITWALTLIPAILLIGLTLKFVGFAIGGYTVAIAIWNVATAVAIGLHRILSGSLLYVRAVLLIQAAATGIATAAQWAFNLSILANPIVLIIVAIVAAIGAVCVCNLPIPQSDPGGVPVSLWVDQTKLAFVAGHSNRAHRSCGYIHNQVPG